MTAPTLGTGGVPSARCSNCAYSDDGESPSDPADGRWWLCRRRAPIVYAAADDGFAGGNGIFPRVSPDDWCGEWIQSCLNTGEPKQEDFLANELRLFVEDSEA